MAEVGMAEVRMAEGGMAADGVGVEAMATSAVTAVAMGAGTATAVAMAAGTAMAAMGLTVGMAVIPVMDTAAITVILITTTMRGSRLARGSSE
jgi:hypothetical protein